MNAESHEAAARAEPARVSVDSVTIRFAGDSGDGMQLTGAQFTESTALAGQDLATFPDYPAEIRAPAGTTYGVSAYQIHFADHEILTHGDAPDVLIAMNPAALVTQLSDLKKGGLVVINTDAFTPNNLRKAGYASNPLEDDTLDGYRALKIDITRLTREATAEGSLSSKEAMRCKNMWTLGLMYWMYGREREPTITWLRRKFAHRPEIAEANIAALNAGHIYGETAELPSEITPFRVDEASLPPGTYRNITGSEATAWGILAGARLSGLRLVLGSYPITPASGMLHALARLKDFGVITFQAEDEIAAICSAIGAAYAGALGVTSSSGPGIALKGEALGLAIATELPLVVVNVQRGGPSTGLPTKTEQADLLQALYGRNGDAPLVVLAAATPSDCFWMAMEACRIATRYMTPVMLLTDGYLANGAEPWRVPAVEELTPFPKEQRTDPKGFHPLLRDPETMARVWAVPGTPGLEHRVGGLERDHDTGNVSYSPENHQLMTRVRVGRIARIAEDLPDQEVTLGAPGEALAVVGWGSTYGAIKEAVRACRKSGLPVSHIHVRHMHPLPRNLGELLRTYGRVIVPEMNAGQLVRVLRAELGITAESVSKVAGKPFKIAEVEAAIRETLEHGP